MYKINFEKYFTEMNRIVFSVILEQKTFIFGDKKLGGLLQHIKPEVILLGSNSRAKTCPEIFICCLIFKDLL